MCAHFYNLVHYDPESTLECFSLTLSRNATLTLLYWLSDDDSMWFLSNTSFHFDLSVKIPGWFKILNPEVMDWAMWCRWEDKHSWTICRRSHKWVWSKVARFYAVTTWSKASCQDMKCSQWQDSRKSIMFSFLALWSPLQWKACKCSFVLSIKESIPVLIGWNTSFKSVKKSQWNESKALLYIVGESRHYNIDQFWRPVFLNVFPKRCKGQHVSYCYMPI